LETNLKKLPYAGDMSDPKLNDSSVLLFPFVPRVKRIQSLCIGKNTKDWGNVIFVKNSLFGMMTQGPCVSPP
jgi:hypothetical protein